MIELCFSNAVKGCLRVAQHCGAGGAGAVGLIYGAAEGTPPSDVEYAVVLDRARRAAEMRSRRAVSLGGQPSDVLTLSLGLDQGDLREPLGEARRALLRSWYEDDESVERVWQQNVHAAARLTACGKEEPVRIWADHTPHSACGLLHAAGILKETVAPVTLMLPPPWQVREDGMIEVYDQGWGEVCPEEFGRFLHLERPLPPQVLKMLSSRWERLQRENAPLRAVINGQVCSVEESFYDALLRKHLPTEETTIGAVIANVLVQEHPGIGDVWLAGRLRRMLADGELRMIREDRTRYYRSVIVKS